MKLFEALTEKSWETASTEEEGLRQRSQPSPVPARTALKLIISVASVLFMLLVVTFAGRMAYEDWRPTPESNLLWLNTFILALSSAVMQWANYAGQRNRLEDLRTALLAGGLTSFAFLAGQVLAWRQLANLGYFDVTNPAIAFFYLITGLHALHLLGGLVAWGRVTEKVWRQGLGGDEVRESVELCTFYWHFLLVVWLVLFGLLFSGNNNLAFLLALCGLR